ncbi:MAG: hypothetical protein IKD08_02310 [Alphaproteobacteria bacterium]|nr:hypothetical protein [Alphaproteobacteria bacterium]
MKRTQKGSLSVEALVMLGLIAALTPVLYKHVSDRREDMDNITQANTMLLLKNAATEYIEANKESITVGTTVIEPADVGLDITGYQIGIKKEADGTINAMIAATEGGNDMKAAKIASLLGVSAGIYSAQDTSKAWGINGIWAEDISSYGLDSLATGVPIITTTYDKEEGGLNEEQLKDFIENNTFERFTAKQICIDNPEIPEDERCIEDWNIVGINPMEVIAACNSGLQSACQKGWQKDLNRSCSEISIKYKAAGFPAPSGIYKITTSATTQVEKACYFVDGELPTKQQLIEGAKTDAIARRYDWENNRISTSCAKIIAAWTSAPTAFYSFVTGISSYSANQICVFTGNRIATNPEVITQCNNTVGTGAACRYGWNNNLNRSCERIIATNSSAASGWYNITTSTTAASAPCYFVGNRVATAAETIAQCNTVTTSANMNSNIACRYGYVKGYNTSCELLLNNYPSGEDNTNSITTASGGVRECCACEIDCAKIGTVSDGECRDVEGWGWVKSKTAKTYYTATTFCNNLGMELKSRAAIQNVGLWHTDSNPFSKPYYYWTTDIYNGNSNYGWVVWLGAGVSLWGKRTDSYFDDLNDGSGNGHNSYALCGPK